MRILGESGHFDGVWECFKVAVVRLTIHERQSFPGKLFNTCNCLPQGKVCPFSKSQQITVAVGSDKGLSYAVGNCES